MIVSYYHVVALAEIFFIVSSVLLCYFYVFTVLRAQCLK